MVGRPWPKSRPIRLLTSSHDPIISERWRSPQANFNTRCDATVGEPMTALDTVADRQAVWSVSADKLKAVIDRARWAVFIFSVLGAFLATLASQASPPVSGTAISADPRTWLAVAGAASLAIATFFTQRLLGQERVMGWVRSRAIAEALKREAYRFTTRTVPYDEPTADVLLDAERKKIEEDGDDLIEKLVTDASSGSVPRVMLTLQQYTERRVDGQIAYYRKSAKRYREIAIWLRRAEFVLALAATLITAVASVTGKSAPFFGVKFDIAALTAVLDHRCWCDAGPRRSFAL